MDKTELENILNQFNLEYVINDNTIEISRNGKDLTLKLPIIISNLEMNLNLFCVYSPEPLDSLKVKFPFYFETPKYGDLICVKKLGKWIDYYQVRTFKEFRNGKIICFKDREEGVEKEIEFDFYSMSDGVRNPNSTFWFNGNQEHLTWEVLEDIMEKNLKTPRIKYQG